MKIVEFVHGFPPEVRGGTENYVSRLVAELAGRGHDVTVIAGSTRPRAGEDVTEDRSGPVPVLRIHRDDLFFEDLDRPFCPPVARIAGELLDRLRPDLVHVQHWVRLTTNLVHVAFTRKIPAVVTLQDLYVTCARGFRIPPSGELCEKEPVAGTCLPCLGVPEAEYAVLGPIHDLRRADLLNELRLAAHVTVASAAHRDWIVRFTGLPAGRFAVVPPSGLTEVRRAVAPPPPPPVRIGVLGALSDLKGQPLVLEALARLPEPAAFDVHVFGWAIDTTVTARLRSLATGLPVTFHGPYVPAELETFPLHLAVLPSLCPETHGHVLDEARGLGLPVVAAATGAYPERIGEGGILFRRGDAEDLARILARLAGNPEELAALRRRVTPVPPFREHVDAVLGICAEACSTALEGQSAFDPAAQAEAFYRRADRLHRRLIHLGDDTVRHA